MTPARVRLLVLLTSLVVVLACVVWALVVQVLVPDACSYPTPPARAQVLHCG